MREYTDDGNKQSLTKECPHWAECIIQKIIIGMTIKYV